MSIVPATIPDAIAEMSDRDFYVSSETIELAEHSITDSTRRAYESDLRAFAKWAEGEGRSWLPATPQTVAAWITEMVNRGNSVATIQRRLSSISVAHKNMKIPSPTKHEDVRKLHRSIRKKIGVTPPNRKAAITSADLAAYFSTSNGSLRSLRNRVLLSWGLSGAFRRSELVALEVSDLEEIPEGFKVRVRRSKTDVEGVGAWKFIQYGQNESTCPVRLMREWLTAAQITGPIFRGVNKGGVVGTTAITGRTVSDVVKEAAVALQRDPRSYGGHSLRRGFCTEVAAAGGSERMIAKQTHHKSLAILRSYIEEGQIHTDNGVSLLGL